MGLLTEGLDLPTRQIVRDMIKIVKSGDEGSYTLPLEIDGKDDYKHGLSVIFDWNYSWKEPNQKYFVDGDYDDESETMGVVLFMNKEYYPESLYDLISDLNDIVRHEYEHHMQNKGFRSDTPFTDIPRSKQPKSYKYYLQQHEIPAVLQGFRRVMKLKNQTLDTVMDDWYSRAHTEKTMPKKSYEKLKVELKKEYEKLYGKKST